MNVATIKPPEASAFDRMQSVQISRLRSPPRPRDDGTPNRVVL